MKLSDIKSMDKDFIFNLVENYSQYIENIKKALILRAIEKKLWFRIEEFDFKEGSVKYEYSPKEMSADFDRNNFSIYKLKHLEFVDPNKYIEHGFTNYFPEESRGSVIESFKNRIQKSLLWEEKYYKENK